MFTGYIGTFYAALVTSVLIAAPPSRYLFALLFLIPLGLLAFGALETWWLINDQERAEVRRALAEGRLHRNTALLAGVITAVCVTPLMAVGLALYNSAAGTEPPAIRPSGIIICVVFLLFSVAPLAPACWLIRRARRT